MCYWEYFYGWNRSSFVEGIWIYPLAILTDVVSLCYLKCTRQRPESYQTFLIKVWYRSFLDVYFRRIEI
jgi:hypothetical protein